jgi:hypothetical protein
MSHFRAGLGGAAWCGRTSGPTETQQTIPEFSGIHKGTDRRMLGFDGL